MRLVLLGRAARLRLGRRADAVLLQRHGMEAHQAEAVQERRGRRPQRHARRLGFEQQRKLTRPLAKHLVQEREAALVLARTHLGSPLRQPVVLQRAPAVDILLEDHLVDQPPRFHAPQRQQAIGPGIGRLAEELADRLGTLDAGLTADGQVRIDHCAGPAVLGGDVLRQLVARHRLAVAANAQPGQPLLQVARLPVPVAVVAAFEQVPQFEDDGLEEFAFCGRHGSRVSFNEVPRHSRRRGAGTRARRACG
ncbi:MAG: hypothetical protein KY476_00470 [Planctomycetes bacterium]|nr:hypothetical protein [Planctomycetota bacterium]